MNNSELEKLLKSAPAPDRAPEFWEEFPKRITARFHWQANRATAPETASRGLSPLAWALGAAAVCLVFVFVNHQNTNITGETVGHFAEAEKCYREIESLFPNQVQCIIFDETGPRIVLGEKADVPASTPLYLKICGPRGCQRVVTFSGQQIRVNGETCDVLLDASGNVLLVGKQLVWSSASLNRETGRYRIEARLLEASS